MYEVDEGVRSRCSNARSKSVLKYLREMVKVCRYHRRRDLKLYYEEAWEFASQIIYGPLPARNLSPSTGSHPDSVISEVPAGFRSQNPISRWPLRKIIKRFSLPYQTWEIRYETLECAHIVVAPIDGPASKSRRCARCLADQLARKKKPVISIAAAPRKKAVSA